MSNPHPRRTHRKRTSALRVSTDTISTLPEYNITPWHRPEDLNSDLPPDYPDSAEEADEDTDCEAKPTLPHPPSLPASPRRIRRFPAPVYRRRQSIEEPNQYLDTLLERSVHALEMSNALLQSSISTQSSLSAVLVSDSAAERALETQAVNLSARIRGNGGIREHWVDDLDEISRGVEGLFGEDGRRRSSLMSLSSDVGTSSSLPTSSFSSEARRQHRKRPSLDLRKAYTASSNEPQLHFSSHSRNHLVSPPPRALTQFGSTADPDSIILPSTLGLCASSSCADWRPMEVSPSINNFNLHASASLPTVTDRPLDPSSPAYNRLSSFVTRSGSPAVSVSSSCTNSPRFMSRNRRGSNSTTSTERSMTYSPSRKRSSPDPNGFKRPGLNTSRSRSTTPKRPISPPPPLPTHWCPPIQEISPSSSSSSSDESCCAKLTVQSLRKILDEQPSPVLTADSKKQPQRPPAFLPRTPAPGPSSSTSTATASISRLFTKATHSSSTRPPSPPRQSSMKQHSASPTPTPSPTMLSIPDMIGGVTRILGSSSASSSGRTTPKRISFAELPESYASSRGGSSKFQGKRKRTGKRVDSLGDDDEREGGGWWSSWLMGAAGSGVSASRSDILEDRLGRGLGGRVGFGSGIDDWSV